MMFRRSKLTCNESVALTSCEKTASETSIMCAVDILSSTSKKLGPREGG